MVEQGGTQVSSTETGAGGGGEGLSSSQPPRQRGWKEREVCGVWCGGDVWICSHILCGGVLFTHCLG